VPSGIQGRVVSEYTDVSEVRTAFITVTPIMEAVRTSETLVYSETTRCYIPERSHLHTRRRENLKSHKCINNFKTSPLITLTAGSRAWVSSLTTSCAVSVSVGRSSCSLRRDTHFSRIKLNICNDTTSAFSWTADRYPGSKWAVSVTTKETSSASHPRRINPVKVQAERDREREREMGRIDEE
jgi:hypothetical protein